MRIFALLTLFLSFLSFAQDEMVDVRFLSTQKSMGNPFALPFSFDLDGNYNFFGGMKNEVLSFQPLMQLGFTRKKIEYSQPVVLNRFGLYPQQKELGWIEVKRQRIEVGIGLSLLTKTVVSAGLAPYKGAMQTLIRHKSSSEEKSLPFKMPRQLKELASWNVDDMGTFQTYGGLMAFVGLGVSIFDLVTYDATIQNQFLVEIVKQTENEISLSIEEEQVESRQWRVGPMSARASLRNFKGKKFRASFLLDITNPEHQELYKEALLGHIHILQKKLPSKLQNLTWTGKDKETYIGVPGIAGKQKVKAQYILKEDDEEAKLNFESSMSKGYFTSVKNIQNFAYQVNTGIVLVWTSEIKKADLGDFKKYFYNKARILGVKGFGRPVKHEGKFGAVVSQVGLFMTKEEFDHLNESNLQEVRDNLFEKCLAENLDCYKEKKLNKIMSEVSKLVKGSWDKISGELGILLLKEPALVHAIVKTLQKEKEVYFKFLSEKYQSLEGSAAIEL